MKAQWEMLIARFDARNKRERLMLAAGLLLVVFFVADSLLISSPMLRGRAQAALAEQQEAEQQSLTQQLQGLQAEMATTATNRESTRKALTTKLEDLEGKLRSFDGTLVTPQAAPALLERLMGRRKGLQMLGLRTLAPVPALDRPDAEGGRNVYRHGIEVRLAGSYADLLGYLSDLEATPERLLWEGASLSVDAYPRSVLTLRVYTLSLDKAWLVL